MRAVPLDVRELRNRDTNSVVQRGGPRMMTRTKLAPVALAVGVAAFAAPANAQSPAGVWLTKDQDAQVRIADCGGAICGTIVWLKEAIDKQTGKPPTDGHNPDPAK